MITLYFFFPVATTLLTLIKSVSLRPPWPNEYRLRLRSWVTQTSRVRIPGTPVTPLLQRPIYPDCACRLQWETVRCGKHVHADYMSVNMILTAISHAVSTVRRVSRSAVYYTHQSNSLP